MNIDIMKCQLVKEQVMCYDTEEISSETDAYNLALNLGLDRSTDEYFYLFCTDTKGRVTGIHEISHGDLCSTMVHPREVMKRALLNNAYGFIVAHNHPSGDATPSREDIETTGRLEECGNLMGIHLLDHIIIGDGRYASMRALGYID